MIVEEQRIVSITYDLHDGDADGPLLERMDHKYPLTFYVGAGKLLPAFEERLIGLEEGQTFQFSLSPDEAYGSIEPDQIVSVPKAQVEALGSNVLIRGNYLTVTDDQGRQHNGRILTWDEEQVRVNLNHALAGKILYFKGVILHVRAATVDEHIRKSYIPADGFRRPDFKA